MDKRKLFVSILAGIMAAVMLLGLVASFIPTRANAATSSELKAQLDKLKEDKAKIDAKVNEIKGQIKENNEEYFIWYHLRFRKKIICVQM